jgi:hypothetical protein
MLNNCKNCKTEVNKNFCPNCGTQISLPKINGRYIFNEITSLFSFDKGMLFTIKELLIRPGQSVNCFINEDRNRLIKPLMFLIICSLFYTFAQQLLHFEDSYASNGGLEASSAVTIITEWIQTHYGYANIIMAIFIALWMKLLFRKYNYNFFEIVILLCFLMGIGMLIYMIFGIIDSSTEIRVLHFGGIIGIIYVSWASGQFFDKKKKANYFKAALSYLLGMITFVLTATILGVVIDLL